MAPSSLRVVLVLALGMKDIGMLRRAMCYADQKLIVLWLWYGDFGWSECGYILAMELWYIDGFHHCHREVVMNARDSYEMCAFASS